MKEKGQPQHPAAPQRFVPDVSELRLDHADEHSTWSAQSEAEQRLRIFFDYAPDAIVMLDTNSGRFFDANLAAERLFGLSRDALLKLGPFDVSPSYQPGCLSTELGKEKITEAIHSGAASFEWWHCDARGRRFPCDVHLLRIPWEDRTVIRGSMMEISERKLLELSEVGRSKILEQIAADASLTETLGSLVLAIEQFMPGMVCSILLLDQQSQCLRHGAAPNLPDFYNEAVDGLKIGPTVGSCGAAAFTGQRVIVSDVMTHPNWAPFREYAARAHFQGCWSEPVLSLTGEVLGTFAMYYAEPSEPAPVELKAIQSAAQLTAIAIERLRAQQSLQELNATLERRIDHETRHLVEANQKLIVAEQEARLAAVAFDGHDSIVITEKSGKILRTNQSFTKLTGYTAEEVIGKTPRILRSGHHGAEFYRKMWSAIGTQGYWEGEIWNKRKDGEVYLQRLTITAVRNSLGEITHYVANGQDLTLQKQAEAEHAEILAASSIQRALLPSASPQLAGFDIAGAVYPADCVSGDFFNFLPLGHHGVGLLVADVSGHGLGPGLLMSQAQAHLHSLAELCADPGDILNRANQVFTWNNTGYFVTMFLGRLDAETRSFTYAGAGHEGYLMRANGQVQVFRSTGVPLGIEENWTAPSTPATALETGDLIVLPTDGIEEAMSPEQDFFGQERMFDVIRRNAEKSAAEITEALYLAARDFAAGEAQKDDMTAIIVKVLDT